MPSWATAATALVVYGIVFGLVGALLVTALLVDADPAARWVNSLLSSDSRKPADAY